MNFEQKIILTLLPKKTGILTIPSLEWDGQKTQSIQIEVKPASDMIEVKNEAALFIQAQLLTKNAYEGAGITYRAEVFDRLGIIEGQFSAPYLSDAQIFPIGESRLSQQEKDGQLYRVFTQDYIIFPEKSGEFTITPTTFTGYYRSKNNQNFGFMDSFIFQPKGQKEVIVRAKPIEINVLNRPEQSLNQWWLPSSKVTLSEKWTNLEDVKVGQPITRTILLTAFNVLGNMLPDIEIQSSDDFKVYAEDMQKTQTYEENIGLIGSQTRTFVFIPLKSGLLTLPEIKINWFDVSEEKIKQATLPAKKINVLDNPQIVSKKPSDQTPALENIKEINLVTAQQNVFAKENNILYFVSGLSLGIIIALFILIILLLKQKKKNKLPELYPQNK